MDAEKHYVRYLAPGCDRDLVLEDLMTAYGEDVWNFAFFLTRRADAAGDISQDVFLIVYNRLYAFRGECSIKSWILGITRNKALNYRKNAFIRKVTLTGAWVPEPDRSPSAEQTAFRKLAARELWERVMALPMKFREAVILAYHLDLPIGEIAAALQVSEGTVKSRLYRAKRKMAALLEAETRGE
ncbi:RNA polymerase sigma factor [Paenibacillus arenilitoris]|uniref:RNA polymerase sigma factor n=1 Tax=Paenibacillus arenilitoris TaxID=2772299 RepID=UPI00168A25DF|nr:sigma-70 family RNA polymerase sigma factor [Paenibacillus arenilitoris]